MNRLIYIFVLAVILGALGGYYYHEALDQKVIYERNVCFEKLNSRYVPNVTSRIIVDETTQEISPNGT